MKVHTLTRFEECTAALCDPKLVQAMYDAGGVVMDDVLLNLHGDAHKRRRHLALRVFRRDFARHYEQEVFPVALSTALASCISAREADMVQFGHEVTMNLTADFAGIDRHQGDAAETLAAESLAAETVSAKALATETNTLLALVRKFGEGATLVHSTRDHDLVRAEVRAALASFEREFLAPSVARRQALLRAVAAGTADESTLPRDMLTVLLRNEDRIALPHDVLTREIAFYLQAGSHSTGNAMVHTLHELLAWCAREPDQRMRLLSDALCLQRAVHESLRLHPASPVAWRRALEPCLLPNGVHAAIGDRVVLDLLAANCDAQVFGDDANCFNPMRRIHHPRALPFGLTFGTGVHMCLGRDLDGGIARPLGISDATPPQLGIVTCLVQALLAAGVAPDPTRQPSRDTTTARSNWATYPVRFVSHPTQPAQ